MIFPIRKPLNNHSASMVNLGSTPPRCSPPLPENPDEDQGGLLPTQPLLGHVRSKPPHVSTSASMKRALSIASQAGPSGMKKSRHDGPDGLDEQDERQTRPLPARASGSSTAHLDPLQEVSSTSFPTLAERTDVGPSALDTWFEQYMPQNVDLPTPIFANTSFDLDALPFQYQPPGPFVSPTPSPSPSPVSSPVQHAFVPLPPIRIPQPFYPVPLLSQHPRLQSPPRLRTPTPSSPASEYESESESEEEDVDRSRLDFILELLQNPTYLEAFKTAVRDSPLFVEILQEVVEGAGSSPQEKVDAVQCFRLLAVA